MVLKKNVPYSYYSYFVGFIPLSGNKEYFGVYLDKNRQIMYNDIYICNFCFGGVFMNLVSAMCPNCGAKLELDENMEKASVCTAVHRSLYRTLFRNTS